MHEEIIFRWLMINSFLHVPTEIILTNSRNPYNNILLINPNSNPIAPEISSHKRSFWNKRSSHRMIFPFNYYYSSIPIFSKEFWPYILTYYTQKKKKDSKKLNQKNSRITINIRNWIFFHKMKHFYIIHKLFKKLKRRAGIYVSKVFLLRLSKYVTSWWD